MICLNGTSQKIKSDLKCLGEYMKKNTTKLKEKSILKTRITKRIIIRSFVCFVIIFAILNFTIYMISQNQINHKKDTVGYISTITFDKISVSMQMIDTKIKSLIDFSIDSKGNVTDFERAAATILGNDNVSTVALAPKGIIQYVYPYAGNQSFIGYDFEDSSIEAKNAETLTNNNQNSSTICGPYLFQNGKTYLIVKVPVLIKDGNSTAELWGYACAFIDFPKSLKEAGFSSFADQKYNYQLYQNDINNKEKIILSSDKNKIKQGIVIHREIFNQTWNVRIEPENGWYNKNQYILQSIMMLIISILISVIIFDYFRLKDTGKILTRFVNIDTLTGVFSRKYLFDYVEAEIERNSRFAICYIDVDKFKEVNDEYGHEIGDKLLLEIGKRIQE